MMLHAAIRKVAVGDCLKLLATDPSTERDVTKFCHFLGHELLGCDLLESDQAATEYHYLICKKP
mgnify:CR=1 FL=1